MLKVKIQIENDKGLKSEIELTETDKFTELFIVQNVFDLFGIKSDISNFAKTMDKVENAYSQFFSEVDPVESNVIEMTSRVKQTNIKKNLIDGFEKNINEIESTYKETNDQPEFVHTGIKVRDGKSLYRTRYKCYACYFKGTLYIPEDSKHVWCQRCNEQMEIRPAHPKGFPNRDTFGNFYVAGEFYDWNMENLKQ